MSYVRLGVRYKRLRNHPHRWGDGKVHVMIWRRDWRQWVKACRFDDVSALSAVRGEDVPDDEPVTCKACARVEPVGAR